MDNTADIDFGLRYAADNAWDTTVHCAKDPELTGREFLDLIAPNHDRTSCSDKDVCNGYYTRNGETWHGRCRRCMLLETLKTGKVPPGYDQDECNG